MWPIGTTEQKEERIETTSQAAIIGIDVWRDWLDIHCLSGSQRLRLPDADEGHARLAGLAQSVGALVCFEATGGQEWRLWAALDGAGVAHDMFQAALVASRHNPVLRTFSDRLRAAGKPHNVVITAVARKLVTMANALCRSRQKWTCLPA